MKTTRVCCGLRSCIEVTDDARLFRVYYDTHRAIPLKPTIDANGHMRLSGNRLLSAELRNRPFPPHLPPYLQRALNVVRGNDWSTIHDIATSCGVLSSTAWNYVCLLVEREPSIAERVYERLVCPSLRDALESPMDRNGRLVDVMERINQGVLSGDVEWRCQEDRYSQLRLARVCRTVLNKL